MNDEFKRKLEAYEKGKLSDTELKEFEKELEKLESYQEFLEKDLSKETNGSTLDKKREQRILRRGKWKARVQTAFFALGIFLIFTIVSSTLTAVYYSWGNPDRVDVFRNIIDYTLTITNPYGDIGGTSTNSKPYFGLEATRDINKRVGRDTIKVGELEVNFLFSLMTIPEREYFGNVSQNTPVFTYPDMGMEGRSDWNKLEQLPEGTVVSAYVSFANLTKTEEVFDLLEGKEIDLTWLAVNTGFEATNDRDGGIVTDPLGFPSFPIWHEDDMILGSREEEKGLFGSKIVSEGYSSPEYKEGEADALHEQFLKTLNFLKDHERKANNLYFGKLNLADRINFLQNNEIEHYGAVITGPTKEVLKLQDESWINVLEVDEVMFWNWNY